jgi:hypothetical protein
MDTRTDTDNMLYELAQTMAAGGNHPVAIALRRLARAGYTNLDKVDNASDWTLLSISGMGAERLRAVRRLTRPDWQPPSPQAVKAASQFLTAARFALRFWSQETLTALIEGSVPEVAADGLHESRWAIELFSTAVGEALPYCRPEELIGVLNAESCGFGQTAVFLAESS